MARRKKGKGKKRQPMTRRERSADAKKRSRATEGDAAEASAEAAERTSDDGDGAAEEPEEAGVEAAAEDDGDGDGDADDEAAGEDADDDAGEAAAGDGSDDNGDSGDNGGSDDDGDSDDDGEIPKRGASWGWPLAKLDRKWTWLEVRLLFTALMLLTVLLCLWFAIRGMKEPLTAKESAGTIFRAMVGMGVLGGLARAATRGRLGETQRNIATVVAVLIGAVSAPAWRGVGIAFFTGLLDWLQEGSSLTLMGGLKGVSTRLTMTVALLGASLAAATGTHINIDVVVRFIPERFRRTVNVAGSLATAVVCIAAAIGFYDFIAVTGMGAPIEVCPEQTAAAEPAEGSAGKQGCRPPSFGERNDVVMHELGEHFFLWRKQAKLDIGAIPYVFAGKPWNADERFSGADWNKFLDEEGFVERYGADKIEPLRASGEDLELPRIPFVTAPGVNVRGALVHSMDLIFPLGFFMIGLRFVLRALLVMSGFIALNEHEAGDDEDEDEEAEDAGQEPDDDDELAAEGAV